MLVRVRVKRVSSRVMPSIMPPAAMAPPKHMAQMMSQMVSIIPAMPRVAMSSLTSALPVSSWVAPKSMVKIPLVLLTHPSPTLPAISVSNWGWKMTAKMMASRVERKSVMMEGTRLAMRIPVATGTISSHGVMQNLLPKVSVKSAMCEVSDTSWERPATPKMMSANTMEGTVVYIR